MTGATWFDASRDKDEKQWVAEVFRHEDDEEPMQTLGWFTTEEEALQAAALFIYETETNDA